MKRGSTQAAAMAAAAAATAMICGSAPAATGQQLLVPLCASVTMLDTPTPEQVMANAVAAMGGREKIDAINTLRAMMEMTVAGPQGEMTIEMESAWSREGGRLTRAKTPMGEMEMGSDGKTSWMKNPMGYGPLPAKQAEALDTQSSMFINMLDPERTAKKEIAKIENAGVEKFAEKECYRLHYTNKDGKEGDLFYEVASSLPVGFQRTDGDAAVKMVLSEWKEEAGVQVFRKIESHAGAQAPMVISVKAIEINTLDDAAFAVPEGAKKTLQPAAGDDKPATPTTKPATKPDAAAASGAEIKFEDLSPQQQETATKAINGLKAGGDVEKMKQATDRLASVLGMLPPDQLKTMEYVIQEMRKEIAKLGG